ncbi:MAG: iron-sulfur cluster carrier protein ApbC [Gammaproteobacteria bacterium]|nr:iron-sulfur cluster carrier protein ApbC [Gammaproteobacteria bacterium]
MEETEGRIVRSIEKINHIVCVASGKGGVGKSTTAVNLALALSKLGRKVGILDADIYGPSLPLMMGVPNGTRPKIHDKKFMLPLLAHGIECNSMGFLVDQKTAMVWRAPMIISAFKQILNDTAWSELDYLIIDMPPGTGDIQLSLAQSVKVSGAVIVTTPQDVALSDARKGIEMFKKVDVPILGVVENMSMHTCTNCGHEEAIFGTGGGDSLSAEYGVEVIGRLPLDITIRETTDAGNPVVASKTDHAAAKAYIELGKNVERQLQALAASDSAGPTITISDD